MLFDEPKFWRINDGVPSFHWELEITVKWTERNCMQKSHKIHYLRKLGPTVVFLGSNWATIPLATLCEESRDYDSYLAESIGIIIRCIYQVQYKLISINRIFKKLTTHIFILLYSTKIRPHRDYCVLEWAPDLICSIAKFKRSMSWPLDV